MKILGGSRRRLKLRQRRRIFRAKNRAERKRLKRAGLIPTARLEHGNVTLTAAQQRRLERQKAGQKQPKIKCRYPKPGCSVQIFKGAVVTGDERSQALLSSGTFLQIHRISRTVADLLGVDTWGRENLDKRVIFMREGKFGELGFLFMAVGKFIPLKRLPDFARLTVTGIPVARMQSVPKISRQLYSRPA